MTPHGDARLRVRHLSVSFGAHRALVDLDLDVPAGSIVALLGANGSGKSTTVKALTGVNPVEPGAKVSLAGRVLGAEAMNPTETRKRGIRVVHQEAPLVAELTVAEAIAVNLGFPTSAGFIRWRRLAESAGRVLSAFDIDIEADRLCGSLSPSERALVSLAVALGDIPVESAVLILDESTASLSTSEAERFLEHVRAAADRGLAVLMVTHRLPEVRRYCDAVVVLRDGVDVAHFDRTTFDERDVVAAMVGGETSAGQDTASSRAAASGDVRLLLAGVHGPGVVDASVSVHRGEILGVTGRPGGGAAELLRLLGGIEAPTEGRIEIDGTATRIRAPLDAIRRRIYYISANRLIEGGVPTMSVAENLTLPRVERYGLGNARATRDVAGIMSQLDVRPPNPAVPFSSLSGGNQQKVLLGRWLLLEPSVLLLDDPTVGVDPNTRETIFRVLRELAAAGVSILIRSSEPEQLARLCDRVLVLSDGRLVGELTEERVTIEEISLATFA